MSKRSRFSTNPCRTIGNSKWKTEKYLDNHPSQKQMSYYEALRQECSKRNLSIKIPPPTTRKEYSECIDWIKELLKEDDKKKNGEKHFFDSAQIEEELIFLFRQLLPEYKKMILENIRAILGNSGEKATEYKIK